MTLNQSLKLEWSSALGLEFLAPPVPGIVFTTRVGGCSAPPFASLNLSVSCGDRPEAVTANRGMLSEALGITPDWAIARQVHGREVLTVGPVGPAGGLPADAPPPDADALVVTGPGLPVAVLVADCVPIALAAPGVAGAVHAGWRGLCAGVVEVAAARVTALAGAAPTAWIGPCIGPCCYEVGPEVPAAFAARHPGAPDFSVAAGYGRPGICRFDLRAAAAHALATAGATVAGSLDVPCTMCDPRFFSHRRDGRPGPTGRQALVTWVPAQGTAGVSGVPGGAGG